MVIAAHTSGKKEDHSYLPEVLSCLAAKHPSDRFIIFSENAIPALPDNCISVPVLPKSINKLLLFYWYSYKLPALLIKHNAQAFISDSGMLCAKTDLPQYLYFSKTPDTERKGFFKKLFTKHLAKVITIFSAEDFITADLSAKHPLSAVKIKTVYHGLPKTLSFGNESGVIENNYYLYIVSAASAPHSMTVLKAFSQLKKRQKTAMKLVLLLQNTEARKLLPDLKNYRFREEVIVIENNEERGEIVKNAFVLIWFCNYDAANIAFTALRESVPIIAEENTLNQMLFGNAALLTNITETSVAEKMQLLYKDENLKNILLENAGKLAIKYDTDRAADLIRAAIIS